MQLAFLYSSNVSNFIVIVIQRIVEETFFSVLDYDDVIYATISNLKHVQAVYHSALKFITDDPYGTHHWVLYQKVGWPSIYVRGDHHLYILQFFPIV